MRSLPRAAARECGACSACCTIPSVEELGKDAFTRCAHDDQPRGCDRYATRPSPCRVYECLWIQGEFEEGDRPDRIGVLFDHPDVIAEDPLHEGLPVLCARELRPDGRNEPRAATLLILLTRAMLVRITTFGGGTSVTGPGRLIRELQRRAGGG